MVLEASEVSRLTEATPASEGAVPGDESVARSDQLDLGARALVRAVDLIGDFVAKFEPGRYSADGAALLVAAFTRGERLCGAGKTLAASRVAESNLPALAGHPSGAHWLAGVTGESVGEAVDVLKLGEALEGQPGVDEAYRSGKLSRSGAKIVAGAVKVNPDCEDELLKAAQHDSHRQLRERCLRAKAQGRSKEDAAKAYEAIRKARYCRTWTDSNGAFRLDALFTPDAGATLLAALTAETDRRFEQARKAGINEPTDAYRADALIGLVSGRTTSDASPDRGSGSPADATDGESSAQPASGRHPLDPKANVQLRVDLDALRRGSLGEGNVCEIPGVGPVPIEMARSLMGDSILQLVITNGIDVTTICHLGRSIPVRLKSAIIERDRTCVVPGCDVAHGLEFDHWGVDFADGGAASLENIARLCSHHHYLRTHKGFQLGGGPGKWQWDPPAASTTPSTRTESTARTDGFDLPLFTIEE